MAEKQLRIEQLSDGTFLLECYKKNPEHPGKEGNYQSEYIWVKKSASDLKEVSSTVGSYFGSAKAQRYGLKA